MKQHDDFDVFTGQGFSSYQFDSRQEAIRWLRSTGFKNATYRSNMHGGNRFCKRIRKIFKTYSVMIHPYNKTIAYVGNVDAPSNLRDFWVRVIGKNELN